MDIEYITETMNRQGYFLFDKMLSEQEISYFSQDVIDSKNNEISRYGYDNLSKYGHLDIIKNCFKFTKPYLDLVTQDWINNIVDALVGKSAVIYDVFGLLNTDQKNKSHIRNKYHRDQIYLGGLRASIFVFIPLVDFTEQNGPTEIIPGSHLFEQRPSDRYMEVNKIKLMAKAGQPFLLDASVWHRGGDNMTSQNRPAILIRYQLPFLKRPLDLCEVYKEHLPHVSDLINRRFGINSQEMDSVQGYLCDRPKYGKGLYDISKANFRGQNG